MRRLDVNFGYRIADYNTGRQTDSYKAEVDWEMFVGLWLRGGAQRAVRAPWTALWAQERV